MIRYKTQEGESMQSIDNKIISRIYGKKRGWVFTPKQFSDLGSAEAIRVALHRLVAKGTIRRLARGLYDYPRNHPQLGELRPSVDAIANALKERDAVRIMPSGAYAANLLGLSEQVPMRVLFLTDGPSRKVVVGRQTIELKKTTPRNMATGGSISGLVIQGLRHIGKDRIDDRMIDTLASKLKPADKDRLFKDARYAPGWMQPVFKKVLSVSSESFVQ